MIIWTAPARLAQLALPMSTTRIIIWKVQERYTITSSTPGQRCLAECGMRRGWSKYMNSTRAQHVVVARPLKSWWGRFFIVGRRRRDVCYAFGRLVRVVHHLDWWRMKRLKKFINLRTKVRCALHCRSDAECSQCRSFVSFCCRCFYLQRTVHVVRSACAAASATYGAMA